MITLQEAVKIFDAVYTSWGAGNIVYDAVQLTHHRNTAVSHNYTATDIANAQERIKGTYLFGWGIGANNFSYTLKSTRVIVTITASPAGDQVEYWFDPDIEPPDLGDPDIVW